MTAMPKNPASRDAQLLKLAKGEDCTLRFPGGPCYPSSTVWAHPNSLSENKGMGYKGNDHGGVFACSRCHKIIDQPGPSDPAAAVREAVFNVAKLRTEKRLIEIANSPAMRPWKVDAARRALAIIGYGAEVTGIEDVTPKIRVERHNVRKP